MALVDWDLATSTAAHLGPTGPSVSLSEATSVVRQLRQLADEATDHVTAFTGLSPQITDSPVRVVDRKTWAAVNVTGLRDIVSPLSEKAGVLNNPVTAKVAGVQAGALLAYLSGKVLGQYDVFVPPGQLLLVAPNIVAVERKLRADPHDFRLWVCIHEATHRAQFTGVPWLRDHFIKEVKSYVAASETPRALGQQIGKLLRAAQGKDDVSLLEAMQTPEQRKILDRLTALLTLLEGHAEVVMDGVGPQVIPTVSDIRAAFDRRRTGGSPIEQYLRRLLGMDVKLKQYLEGRKFVAAVIARVGMQDFNRVFTSPETLPRLPELTDPDAWVSRVVTV